MSNIIYIVIVLLYFMQCMYSIPRESVVKNTWSSKDDHSEFWNALLPDKTFDRRSRDIFSKQNTLPEYNANIDTECVLCSQRDEAKQRNHVLSCT